MGEGGWLGEGGRKRRIEERKDGGRKGDRRECGGEKGWREAGMRQIGWKKGGLGRRLIKGWRMEGGGWRGEEKERGKKREKKGKEALTLMQRDGVGIKRPANSGGWGRIKRSANVGRHREEMRPQSDGEQPKLSPTGR